MATDNGTDSNKENVSNKQVEELDEDAILADDEKLPPSDNADTSFVFESNANKKAPRQVLREIGNAGTSGTVPPSVNLEIEKLKKQIEDLTKEKESAAPRVEEPHNALLLSLKNFFENLGESKQKPTEESDEQRLWAAWDAAYSTPQFHIRLFTDSEKLQGSRNYKAWRSLIELELTALRLSPFLEAENANGIIKLSPVKRSMLGAQSLLFIQSSLSKTVNTSIRNATSAFEAFEILRKLYERNRIHDLVSLNARFNALRFRSGFNRERFLADFERCLEDYEQRNTVYSDEVKASKLLEKIDGIHEQNSPFYTFYNSITAQPPDLVTYEFVKERFFQVDLRSISAYQPKRKIESKENSYGKSRKHEYDDSSNKSQKPGKFEKPGSSGTNNSSSKNSNQPQVLGKAKTLAEKYSKEQLESLKSMTKEEKSKIRCKKCGEYFHEEKSCPNPGPMCFVCKRYGHTKNSCTFKEREKK